MPAKLSIIDMHIVAEERGGKCLSERYINNATKLRWECAHGHQWEATPASIRRGTWCPRCGRGRKPHTIADMQQLAAKRGGKCLSPIYYGCTTKLWWECAKGHRWEGQPANIKSGYWCPDCGGSKRLTIEAMQQLAKQRGGKCLSETYINCRTRLWWECARGHRWEAIPNAIKQGSWCPYCAGSIKQTIADMRHLAEARGGKCLSKIYGNANTPLLWECAKGHRWNAQPGNIKAGTWCPYCAGAMKLTIADMRHLAEARGGKCLSKIYSNARTPLLWECAKGHRWNARPGDIKRGTWCPTCARLNRRRRRTK